MSTVGNVAQVVERGDFAYAFEVNDKNMLYAQNQSGNSLSSGTVVIRDDTNSRGFLTTTTRGHAKVLGVIPQIDNAAGSATDQSVDNTGWAYIQNSQYISKVLTFGAISQGQYLITSVCAGRAVGVTSHQPGVFGVALTAVTGTGASSVQAILFPVQQEVGSGTDAAKTASPAVGALYVATDTSKTYACYSAGTWTEVGATVTSSSMVPIKTLNGGISVVNTTAETTILSGSLAGGKLVAGGKVGYLQGQFMGRVLNYGACALSFTVTQRLKYGASTAITLVQNLGYNINQNRIWRTELMLIGVGACAQTGVGRTTVEGLATAETTIDHTGNATAITVDSSASQTITYTIQLSIAGADIEVDCYGGWITYIPPTDN